MRLKDVLIVGGACKMGAALARILVPDRKVLHFADTNKEAVMKMAKNFKGWSIHFQSPQQLVNGVRKVDHVVILPGVFMNESSNVELLKALTPKIVKGGSVCLVGSCDLANGPLSKLMAALIDELDAKGIRINLVATDAAESGYVVPYKPTPKGRKTLVDDVAQGVQFMLACRGVNGHLLVVDSGKSVMPVR
jgi:NAD(P)-dependent dehydrogenase (short-subunit alcohol dehydrogenase family)